MRRTIQNWVRSVVVTGVAWVPVSFGAAACWSYAAEPDSAGGAGNGGSTSFGGGGSTGNSGSPSGGSPSSGGTSASGGSASGGSGGGPSTALPCDVFESAGQP